MRLRRPYINAQEFSANNISTNLFCVSIQSRFSALFCLFPAFISSQKSLVVLWQSFLSSFSSFRKPSVFAPLSYTILHYIKDRSTISSNIIAQCSLFMIVRHIFEIIDDSRMRITTRTVTTSNVHDIQIEDDFALRYVRIRITRV